MLILLTAWLTVTMVMGCGGTSGTLVSQPIVTNSAVWAAAWGISPSNADASPDNTGGTDQSFRFLIYPTLGGTRERVRFSNVFGSSPITIGSARLSIGKDGSPQVDAANDVPLTFSGSNSVTLQPGQILYSDVISLSYFFGQSLAVSVFLKGDFPPLTRHDSIFIQNYAAPSGAGDKTSDVAGTSFSKIQADWFLLSGLDVYGDYQGTVVLLGSSTTDGIGADFGSSESYPTPNVPVAGQHMSRLSDQLALLLHSAGIRMGVVNAGISGNTLTAPNDPASSHLQDGLTRFNRDVVQQTNVKVVVDYLGAIDIRGADCKTAATVEQGTQSLVSMASAAKIPVILVTLPPSSFCTNPSQPNFGPSPSPTQPYAGGSSPGPQNGADRERLAFDAWVRQVGVGLPGVIGIADFDMVIADPAHPSFMLPQLNSRDNYHLDGAGYKAEAQAIPINLLRSVAQ